MSGKRKKGQSKTAWKKAIKISQNYICPVCGKKGTDQTLDIHHCKNKCRGGNNSKQNCVAVHRATCHRLIHKRYGNEYFDPRTMKL